ncbi:MAG TPA: hypoxanthine phosphoribosyltransferase [Candidatus Krumholzibacteria bacterium]|nr:hypoxanthine phosphoribosyltransferase [Candidatus Krumholzibacteria bacterium]
MNTIGKPTTVVLSAEEIAGIVARLGAEISRDYEGRHPVLISLLKGGVIFLADLIRQVTIPHHIEFLQVSSYNGSTASSGRVKILNDLQVSIEGRHVLIVEDVVDTGMTLAYIVEVLKLRNPASLEICALLRKRIASPAGIPLRYLGREIPDQFVVGYGLDYRENFRHLPFIAAWEPDPTR